jgi:hypothetical protein
MLLRILCAKVMLAKMAMTAAFTVGSVAGAAAVVGVCAARRSLAERRPRDGAAPTG